MADSEIMQFCNKADHQLPINLPQKVGYGPYFGLWLSDDSLTNCILSGLSGLLQFVVQKDFFHISHFTNTSSDAAYLDPIQYGAQFAHHTASVDSSGEDER